MPPYVWLVPGSLDLPATACRAPCRPRGSGPMRSSRATARGCACHAAAAGQRDRRLWQSPSWHWSIATCGRRCRPRGRRARSRCLYSRSRPFRAEQQAICLVAHGRWFALGPLLSLGDAPAATTTRLRARMWLSFHSSEVLSQFAGTRHCPRTTRWGPDGNDALPGLLSLGLIVAGPQ